jgi:hypothetical protein
MADSWARLEAATGNTAHTERAPGNALARFLRASRLPIADARGRPT